MITLVDGMNENKFGLNYLDVYNNIYRMMGHEDGIKEIFYSKIDRLLASYSINLIFNDNNIIGFLNLVSEGIDNIGFIDEGILKKYRNMGFGKKAILVLNPEIYKQFIIGETLKINTQSNKSASSIASLIYETEDRNYYLFQDRKEEFYNSNEYYLFLNHIEKQKRLK